MSLSEIRLSLDQKVDSFLLNRLIENLIEDNEIDKSDEKYHARDHKPMISGRMRENLEKVTEIYMRGSFAPPDRNTVLLETNLNENELSEILAVLIENKTLIKIDDTLIIHVDNKKTNF